MKTDECKPRSSVRPPFAFVVFRLSFGVSCLFLASALFLALGAPAHSQTSVESAAFKLVPLDSERLPAEMKRVDQGVLVQMPRADFEERARVAALAGEAQRKPPRLVEARYRARLTSTALEGSGQWKVVQPVAEGAARKAVLPLTPFNLALNRPRFEDRDALLAAFDGKNLGLLVDRRGEQSLFFDWSARGDHRPDGLHFDLQLPPCAVAALELDLPADRIPAVTPESCLLSGPHAAESAERRTWRIGFAGQSKVDLMLRRADSGAASLLFAALDSRQTLTPDAVEADYEFHLEAAQPSTRELVFECDPALRPYEVTAPQLDTWETRTAAAPAATILLVRLREGVRSGVVRIRCLGPLAAWPSAPARADGDWLSPSVRLSQAVSLGETLSLRLASDLRFENWQAGDYRLTQSTAEPGGWQVFMLVGGGLESGQALKRPSLRVSAQPADFKVRQQLWWQVGTPANSVTAWLHYDVTRGRLFQLPVALPVGWEVDRVETTPTDLLRNWSVRQQGARQHLLVDLQRALRPPRGTPADSPATRPGATRLAVRLRPAANSTLASGTGARARLELPFPDVEALGARAREGTMAIDVDDFFYHATVANTTQTASAVDETGPWRDQVPDFFYHFRSSAPAGTLILTPRQARMRARCATDVVIATGLAHMVTRLDLQPEVGGAGHIDIQASTGGVGEWQWKTVQGANRVTKIERLPGAGGQAEETWRLTFARPLHEPAVLQAARELKADAAGGRWHVPLLTVPGSDRFEGEACVFLAGRNLVQVETTGLRAAPLTVSSDQRPAWRVFRYSEAPVALAIAGQGSGATSVASAGIDQCTLITTLEPGGRVLNDFRFRVWNWREGMPLLVRLPAGAEALTARVDGRRIIALAPPVTTEEGLLMELPVPARSETHSFELSYALAGSRCLVGRTLATTAPILPVTPLHCRHLWRLPPGVAPLFEQGWLSLPGSGHEAATLSWERGEGDYASLASSWDLASERVLIDQRPMLMDACAVLVRDRQGKGLTLGQALDSLLQEQLKDQMRIIVDAAALAEAGVGPTSTLPAAAEPADQAPALPWEGLGLVHVSCRAAALLTTRQQAERWGVIGGPGPSPARDVEEAVRQAVREGHDVSGRFLDARRWLAGSEGSAGFSRDGTGLGDRGPGWTEWEFEPGEEQQHVWVVRHDLAPALGLVLALVLGFVLFRRWPGAEHESVKQDSGVRSGEKRSDWNLVPQGKFSAGTLLASLGVTGLALLWLPSALKPVALGPFCASGCLCLVGYLNRAGRRLGQAKTQKNSAATAMLVTFMVALNWSSQATAPTDTVATVYLVSADTASGTPIVLAPATLLTQWERQERGLAELQSGVVLLGADYTGKIVDQRADMEATFRVFSFADQAGTLSLPLEGVEVQEMLLDGARAYPQVADAPRQGYQLRIDGSGVHLLRARFSVGLQGAHDERELRFGIPALPQAHLRLDGPAGLGYFQATTCRGQQRLTNTAEFTRLEADLGRIGDADKEASTLSLRWRPADAQNRLPLVRVREAYLWKLRASYSSLHAVLQYAISQGAAKTLALQLPAHLEVRGVETTVVGGRGPVRLSDWQVVGAGDSRRLQLEFQEPVSAGVQVVVELIASRPLVTPVNLPLPLPLDVHWAEEKDEQLPLLAFQAEGLTTTVIEHLRLTGIRPEDFLATWSQAGQANMPPLAGAYSFRRKAGAAPLLRVQLRPPTPALSVSQEIVWLVGPRRADMQATARCTAQEGDMARVDLLLTSGLVLTDITGRDVRHWNRAGPRVQVWLRRSLKETELQLQGWCALRPGDKDEVLDLPRIEMATAQTAVVRLAAQADRALTPVRLDHMVPLPALDVMRWLGRAAAPGSFALAATMAEPRLTSRDLLYWTEGASYGGTFAVRPLPAPAGVRLFTFADVSERELVFEATLEYDAGPSALGTLPLRIRNWDGGELQFDSPQLAFRRELRRDAAGRYWLLEMRPGAGGACVLHVRGSLPLDEAAGGVLMPDISVPGVAVAEHWLAVTGRELRSDAPRGLEPLTDAAPARAAWARRWPKEAERVRRTSGGVWRVTQEDWRLRVTPRDSAALGAPVRVVLAEPLIQALDGRHWLHQVDYWLVNDVNADLRLTLPQGASFLSAALDGKEVVPLEMAAGRYSVPLPNEPGGVRLRLRWLYESEPRAAPRLDLPQLDTPLEGPLLWTVYVPTDLEAMTAPRAGSRAVQLLYRADAVLRLCAHAAGRIRSEGDPLLSRLTALEELFFFYCRLAEYELAAPSANNGATGPAGQTLERWLMDLKEQNAQSARAQGFDKLRAQAERRARQPRDSALDFGAGTADAPAPFLWQPARGRPLLAVTAGDAPLPDVPLRSAALRRNEQRLFLSILLVLLGVTVWLISYFPRVVAVLRAFWPEQMLAASYFAWHFLEPSWIAFFLALFGVCGRVFVIGQGVWLIVQRQLTLEPAAKSSSGT